MLEPPSSTSDPAVDLGICRRALLAWYRLHARDLPWRRTRDPYAVWISETMLQQTRVDTVVPRYRRWLSRFPDLRSLAAASLDEVLAEWAGLGYYARARNLHRAAREVEERYAGRFPEEEDAAAALPGVGPYTVGAVLSIALDRRAPLLDGNVARVLCRLMHLEGDPRSAPLLPALWRIARRWVAEEDDPSLPPGELNQSLMELGATVCTPRAPSCGDCPLRDHCLALRRRAVDRLPSPRSRRASPEARLAAIALVDGASLLLVRRPARGLWGGLWELPTTEVADGEEPLDAALRAGRACAAAPLDSARPTTEFLHVLTHRRLRIHGFVARAPHGAAPCPGYDARRSVTREEAGRLGIARPTVRLLAALPDEEFHDADQGTAGSRRARPGGRG